MPASRCSRTERSAIANTHSPTRRLWDVSGAHGRRSLAGILDDSDPSLLVSMPITLEVVLMTIRQPHVTSLAR